MSTPRIAIIVGTTREGRFSERLADFAMSQVSARDDLEFDLVDLRDHPLPMFDEPGPPSMCPSQRDEVAAWRDTVAAYDGYIIVTAEYNNSIPAVIKNAIDHVYAEWAHKPVAFAAYGSVGGVRAVQHLRHVAIELQMAPIRASVHIPGGDFMPVMMGQKQLGDLPYLPGSVDAMVDQLAWWAAALHQARAAA